MITLAEQTEGKSGAFIAACCNHAGIYAVDHDAKKTSYEHVKHVLNRMLNKREKDSKPIGFL